MELNKTFIDGLWSKEINVSDFVSKNITSYTGDASFLQGPTERTKHIWNLCLKALEEERANNGVRSLDHTTVSTITSHKAGYIDKENELIVGLQTDELLRRAIKPFGGINVVAKACRENGVEVDDKVKDIFTHYRKTHNDGVFDVYTEVQTASDANGVEDNPAGNDDSGLASNVPQNTTLRAFCAISRKPPARWFAPLAALLMVVSLSGCFDKEGDQRKGCVLKYVMARLLGA